MERFRVPDIPDIPDGAAFQDLPPTYSEAVASDNIGIEKGGGAEGDQDTETERPPRYSQLNLHLT